MNRNIVVPFLAFCVLFCALAAAGCAQDRLTASHGVSYTAAFASQQARPDRAAPVPAPEGLDSQEATIIAETHRRGLAPKGQTVEEPPVLLLTPSKENHASMPVPSVPK